MRFCQVYSIYLKGLSYEGSKNPPVRCSSHEVYTVSQLEALKKLYPDDTFELVPQSDKRNRFYLDGRGYDCEVSNHYGKSA